MAVTTYTAPEYDEKKYSQGIDTSYYTKAIKTYTNQANKQRASQIADAKSTQNSALRQAYVSNVQNRLGLQNSMAQAGIRGGATETANLQLSNQYGQAVNAANTEYNSSVKSINQAVDQNIADYTSDMNSRAEEYRQNVAQAKWKADREDSLNKYNATNEYWSNYWKDFYSGDNIKQLNAAYEKAQKALKNAKTPEERIKQEQRLRGIQARRSELRNKEQSDAIARQTADINKRNSVASYWGDVYLNYYSGASKKTAEKALKSAKEALKKAKTPGEKIRIQQQISGITNRLGVLANAK